MCFICVSLILEKTIIWHFNKTLIALIPIIYTT